MKKHNRTSLTESMPNHRENISLYETRIYATKINKLTGTHTHFNLRDASVVEVAPLVLSHFSRFMVSFANNANRPNKRPMPASIRYRTRFIVAESSLNFGALIKLFRKFAKSKIAPAVRLIPNFVKLSIFSEINKASSAMLLRVSMERFSFQGMVKGMQPSRCLAILGETLRPILASRIYGGSV